ncbi:unnamed protein product [Blepharisma stoltei]|uniref:Uncharacterized protein n=1 Tax=Blepharisma stoltei TaxID=1481888 RepID=A0AAU9JC65_9CILI|nr:unnamed protein product [Blepharisma stoltei]
MEEGQAITSDNSFYDKCKAYLNALDQESYNYYHLKASIERYINDRVDLKPCILGGIFVNTVDIYDTSEEELSNDLKAITAAMYMILKDKEIYLGIDDLKNTIYTYFMMGNLCLW